MASTDIRLIIMGAAGRDFHDFNVYWKNQPNTEVVGFTATQIPDIAGRVYPAELAGPKYPKGIPIHDESKLVSLIKEHKVNLVTLAYSDLPHTFVMQQACKVMAAGADFRLLSPANTMLVSTKPVIAICAVRTGCGKSQTSRRVTQILQSLGKKVAVVRHPMPYGDLTKQICQRFADMKDLDHHKCTIEEREEFEPHIRSGNVVFAGIDYEKILRAAEAEADVVLWDGGNNDTPFFKPNAHIVIADPHRAGHEITYFPGQTNLRMADIIVINKVDTADFADIEVVKRNIVKENPKALVVEAESPVTVSDPGMVKGKKVLVIEDGPTLTHGDMKYGAGHVAARELGAAQIVDPRPYAKGSIKDVFQKYSHLTDILPAMGYGDKQMKDMEATINAVPCDLVLIGTPIDLGRLLKINKPSTQVFYDLKEKDDTLLPGALKKVFEG